MRFFLCEFGSPCAEPRGASADQGGVIFGTVENWLGARMGARQPPNGRRPRGPFGGAKLAQKELQNRNPVLTASFRLLGPGPIQPADIISGLGRPR